jgi:fructan beta-fructosidase
MKLEKRYLNLPVKNEAAKKRLRLAIDGRTVREFEIELADDKPDFWVFLDISTFKGKEATLEGEGMNPEALALISQDDAIKGSENLYQERYRPQFHFSSRRGWNNDPNGLVYYKGEYHLFYQHNPYGWKWGNMHWGHAVSADLVHWKELPVAIYPHQYGDWVFSGSAVVDKDNAAGFRTGHEDVIVAAYTSTGRGESIAYSNDRGRTFTDYEGNPVVKHRGRDPKVIWYEPGEHWVMAVYDEIDESRCIAFYTSSDLKTWKRQSRIEGYYECPEIFQLPVDGNKSRSKWVVYAADGSYAIGSFDGREFTTESGKHAFNHGNCFYASQTWSNVPPEDGRRIQIAWGRIGHPDMPFNQMMNFPVELTLRATDEGVRMFAYPVKEINLLHSKEHIRENLTLEPGDNPLKGIVGDLFDIHADFAIGQSSRFGLNIRGTQVTYDAEKQELSCKDKTASLKSINGNIRLRLLVDRMSIEIFGNDGRIYMPMGVIPDEDDKTLAVYSEAGNVRISSLKLYELRSAWQTEG